MLIKWNNLLLIGTDIYINTCFLSLATVTKKTQHNHRPNRSTLANTTRRSQPFQTDVVIVTRPCREKVLGIHSIGLFRMADLIFFAALQVLSATVRLHVAYVRSDFYPLSWNPLSILDSEQNILLEDSKDPPKTTAASPPPIRLRWVPPPRPT